MANIVQLPRPVLNRSLSLARGLIACVPLFQKTGNTSATELVQSYPATLTSGLTWKTGIYGTYINVPSSGADQITAENIYPSATTPITYAALVHINSVNTVKRTLIDNFDSAGSTRETWIQLVTSGTNVLEFGFDIGGTFPAVDWTTGWTAGSDHLVFFVWDRASQIIYADGDPQAKATNASATGPHAGNAGNLFIGGDNRSDPWDGGIYWLGFWNRVLTTKERLVLWRDPFVMFKRPNYSSIWLNSIAAVTTQQLLTLLGIGS